MFFEFSCRWAAWLALLSGLASCSVKEDRSDCPCLLTLDLRDIPAWPVYYSVRSADGLLTEGSAAADTAVVTAVPRKGVEVLALTGAEEGSPAGGGIRIPPGSECPSAYLFRRRVDSHADATRVPVSMHKHFCALSLKLDAPPGNGEPYWTQVRGQVSGLDADGQPVPGDFSCRLNPGGTVRLPRQAPSDALWLDVMLQDQTLRSFSLGTHLLDAGYDWTAPDLEDLTLEIRLSVSLLQLQINAWSATIPLKIEI